MLEGMHPYTALKVQEMMADGKYDFEKKVKAVTNVGERSLSMNVGLLTVFERKQFIEYLRLLNYTVHMDLFETSNEEKDTLFFWW